MKDEEQLECIEQVEKHYPNLKGFADLNTAFERLAEREGFRQGWEACSKWKDKELEILKFSIQGQRNVNDQAWEKNKRLVSALKKLTKGWLYWPSKYQPDPRITMYESRGLKEIEEMALKAIQENKVND